MAEELNQNEEVNKTEATSTEEQKTEQTSEQVQLSAEEELASQHGWVPKDQWTGDPSEWTTAKEFNRRGELFSRIAKYGAENRELRESLKKLFDHNRRLFDAGYKKAMDDLKTQKMQALEEGDTRKVYQVEEQIDELKVEHEKAIKEFDNSMVDTSQSGPNEQQQLIFSHWVDNNPWYGKNASLTQIADGIAKDLVKRSEAAGKKIEYAKLLNEVAREVRENNPEFFPTQRKTSSVDGSAKLLGGSGRKPASGSNMSLSSLSEGEQQIARTIMQSTGMKEDEYMKSYRASERK